MEEFIKILSVVCVSSVKFIAGPTLAYAYNFNFYETIFLTVLGGTAGVIMISYFTPTVVRVMNWLADYWHLLKTPKKRIEIFSDPDVDVENSPTVRYEYIPTKRQKKVFSWRSRRIIQMWQKWGLFGLAIITPVTISIPVGTFIATRLVPNKKKVLLYMFVSVVFWALILASAFQLFNGVSFSELF